MIKIPSMILAIVIGFIVQLSQDLDLENTSYIDESLDPWLVWNH